jgi:hypothetical protein
MPLIPLKCKHLVSYRHNTDTYEASTLLGFGMSWCWTLTFMIILNYVIFSNYYQRVSVRVGV